jgi:GNAT superfamily N-acetyltransferase
MTTVTTTFLEMRSPDQLRAKCCADPRFRIAEVTTPLWQFNRFLYCTVGEPYRWFEKRTWTDQQWREYAESPALRTFAAYHDGTPAGYFELRHDDAGDVQIQYFGLLPAFVGKGFGGPLLTSAIREAWKMAPSRVWVHTCTLDHPQALANYQARGMQIYRVETKEID